MNEPRATRAYRCSPSRFRSAVSEIRDLGGTVDGSESEGKVTLPTPLGEVEGLYLYDGEELSVTLTRKPAMVPERLIWDRLDAACGPPLGRA